MIEIKNLKYTYKNGKTIHFPDWSLRQGIHALVSGRRGTGKSTLLFLLCGILKNQNGDIQVCDYKISGLNNQELNKFRGQNIGYISSNPVFVRDVNLQDNLSLAQFLGSGKENMEKLYILLHEFGIAGKALEYPENLSRLELRIASILRAVINRPRLLLADEPTGKLTDKESRIIFRLLINQALNYESTLILASKDPRIKEAFRNQLKLENV